MQRLTAAAVPADQANLLLPHAAPAASACILDTHTVLIDTHTQLLATPTTCGPVALALEGHTDTSEEMPLHGNKSNKPARHRHT
jgi:hypothetical protein